MTMTKREKMISQFASLYPEMDIDTLVKAAETVDENTSKSEMIDQINLNYLKLKLIMSGVSFE